MRVDSHLPAMQKSFVPGDTVAVLADNEFWLFCMTEAVNSEQQVLSGQWLVQFQTSTEGSSWKKTDLEADVIGRQNVLADVSHCLTPKRTEDTFLLQEKAHSLLMQRVRWEHGQEESANEKTDTGTLTKQQLRSVFARCKIVPKLVWPSFCTACRVLSCIRTTCPPWHFMIIHVLAWFVDTTGLL